ncbi:hypothetical protein FY534_11020 [Alicyclobacillus sp. TC]|uniref:hypothetical protein n=1 Tax=Alicyclobacillus sp. TC TaxID=2606450 RepID=UPI0019328FF4|nr:hypothetical protein [Alicyclobacillus sp. TC]QRF24111.1 hypothetical protein FY534_11020 [Alicyclobacillus sp. TC]
MNQSYQQGGYGMQGQTLSQFATPSQTVQRHIQQDLGYYGQQTQSYHQPMPTSMGYGMGQQGGAHYEHSTFSEYGTPAHVVQQHMQQDLGQQRMPMAQSGSHGSMMMAGGYQQGYSQPALHQVMQAAPVGYQDQMSSQQGPIMSSNLYTQGHYSPQHPYPQMNHGHSMLSEYGTSPQVVQQHIQQDLQYGIGNMTSEQAGHRVGQAVQMGMSMMGQPYRPYS